RGWAPRSVAQAPARSGLRSAAGVRARRCEGGRAEAGDLREAAATRARIRPRRTLRGALSLQRARRGQAVEAGLVASPTGSARPRRVRCARLRAPPRLDARRALPMIESVTLQGRFVMLRPLSRDDVPALRSLAAGPRRTFEWAMVPATERAEDYVENALAQMERRTALVFAICLPSGELVGSTRLVDLQRREWPERNSADHSSSVCSSLARSRSPSVPKPFPGGIFLFICRWYSR